MEEEVMVSGGVEEVAHGPVKWERFMPRMVMRVLLVEPDDSTRQVVAALLRKCGYRVVAVSDGLKAWELLKGTPRNVDLVLTEVEMPSVSGFSLLSLATEHDICKNIPIIMMSTQDSIGTVYKCMLKGAADYLVKPIRRNELHNLWQHVWRRQILSIDGHWPLDGSAALQNGEPAAEKDAVSNQKHDGMTFTQRDEDFVEKGSDVQQSSCMGSDLEPESAHEEQPLKWLFMPKNSSGLALSSCKLGLTLSPSKEVDQRNEQVATEGSGDNQLPVDSDKEAIDLIGAFDNSARHNRTDDSLHHFSRDHDLSTKLNLSLERSDPHDFDNSGTEERHSLKQSNASAFSRYINNSSSETPSPILSTPKSILSFPTSWPKQTEHLLPHQRPYPACVPVKVLRSNSPSTDLTLPNPSTDSQQDPSLQVNSSGHSVREINDLEHSNTHLNDQNTYNGQINEPKFDAFEDRRCCSLSSDRSAASSSANESSLSRLNSMDIGNVTVSGAKLNQSKDEGGSFALNGISQQALQREAAVTKFRLKRKFRCFEKKVRYESRKKLAEQRPRVKGQFVRQATVDMCIDRS
ncbi:two-component response regulator-like APRR5 isoform X1 [Punica granatum]|uniref:Two-component response regulator-like APRR5 isoform X1 n=1 Tax=Punica granatum TaxID=22663 RepID=A0A6P8CK13_PUNGR|nr:two-component response regulator-like APRR5 isoform X1 [Punica granatum]